MQHESEEVVPGNYVAVILWFYSSVLIMYVIVVAYYFQLSIVDELRRLERVFC